MRARLSEVVFGLTLVLAAGGCQEDEPNVFSTGVDRNKPLGMVTGPEAQAVCNATQAWTRESIAQEKQRQLTCRLTATVAAAVGAGLGSGGGGGGAGGLGAVNEAQLRMTCQTAYDGCTMAPAPTEMGPPMCQAFPAGCTATIAEYEACLTDVPAFVDRTLATLPTCETLNVIAILSLANITNTLPDTCKTFQMKCRGASIGGLPPTGGTTSP
jgi:hypothetical protein